MNKKNFYLVLAILIIALIVFLIIINNSVAPTPENNILPEENNIENNYEDSQENLTKIEKQETVTDYLRANISDLSPEEEVLGGTFYITSVDFLDDNNLIVEYEDGHIALIAEVEYEYLDSDNIIINSFNIIN